MEDRELDASASRHRRLVSQFTDARRLLVLRAESGAGKTYLLAHWVRSLPRSAPLVAWMSLDEGGTADSFWFRLASALRTTLPSHLTVGLGELLAGSTRVQHAPALVIDALIRNPEPVLLVFDDIDRASDAAQLGLISVLTRVPHLRMAVTARSPTLIERSGEIPPFDRTVIGSDDLACTGDELASLARELHGAITPGEITALERLTRGHVLGIRLAVDGLREWHSRSGRRRTGGSAIEAMEHAILRAIPAFETAEEEEAALRLSLAPEVDAPLSARLTGESDGWARAEHLEHRGFGRVTERSGRPVLLLQPLVLASLRRRAAAQLPATELRELRLAAYDALAGLGDPVETLELLLDAGADDRVWEHVMRDYWELRQHRRTEVAALLDALPEDRLAASETLAITVAVALSGHGAMLAPHLRALVADALPGIVARTERAPARERFMLTLARFAGLRVLGRYDEAADAVDRLLAACGLAEITVDTASPEWFMGLLRAMATQLFAGRLARSSEIASLLHRDPDPRRRLHRDGIAALVHAIDGDLVAADRVLGGEDPDGWDQETPVLCRRLARSLVLLERGDTRAAWSTIARAEDEPSFHEFRPVLVWVRARLRLVGAEASRGRIELERALAHAGGQEISRSWSARIAAAHADLVLASGAFAEATPLLRDAGDHAEGTLSRARHALLTQRPDRTLALLAQRPETRSTPRTQAEALLLEASAHARLGASSQAERAARQSFQLQSELGLRSPLSLIPAEDLASLIRLTGSERRPRPIGQPYTVAGPDVPLTRRERLVLTELPSPDSIERIAARLHVSPNTVKSQVRSVYRKLGASGRAEAVQRATRLGLL